MNTKMFLIVFMLLSFFSTPSVLAKTRNLLIEESADLKFGPAFPVIYKELIIYQTFDDGIYTLWSFDPINAEKNKFFTGQLWRSADDKYMHVIDEQLFFISGDYDFKDIWKSDATEAGTKPLPSTEIYGQHKQVGDLLFAQKSNTGTLISTDGNTTINHPIQYAELDNICAFAVDDVISKNYDINTNTTTLLRSNAGETTVIPSPESFPDYFGIRKENMWTLDDQCFIGVLGEGQFIEVIIVSRDGQTMKLSDSLDLSEVWQIFNFKNRVYVLSGLYDETKLKRLKTDLTGFDAEFQAPSNANNLYYVTTSDEYIMARSISIGSPHFTFNHYLDQNLTIDQSLAETLGGANLALPNVYKTNNEEVFMTFQNNGRSVSYQLSNDLNPSHASSLNISDAVPHHIITDSSSSDVYMLLTDKISGKRSIYSLADTPDISDSINGQWYNPDIKNQGLSIKTGERVDGSKYLFLTVYTFKDGEPFWLAGTGEISPPQKTIDVLVSDYRGIDMFESGPTPEQNIFGNIHIERTGCNALTATLTTDEEVVELNLFQINNVRFNHLCSE